MFDWDRAIFFGNPAEDDPEEDNIIWMEPPDPWDSDEGASSWDDMNYFYIGEDDSNPDNLPYYTDYLY